MSIKLAVVDGDVAKTLELSSPIDPENLPWPKDSVLIYAIDEEKLEIVGRIGLIHLAHIEGTWIREDHQKGSLLKRLFNKLEEILKSENKPCAWAFALDSQPKIAEYLERLGYKKFPFFVYMKDFTTGEDR